MVKQGIQIYARIKPTRAKTGPFETYEDDQSCPCVAFTVPRDVADGYINNKKEIYRFRFNKVFDQQCKQDVVFEEVAKDVIDNVISGYNGTIFAYGQTGSGKTFTITGGAEKYGDRGLIPRTLSYIFEHFEQNSEAVHTAHISYLEIYNECGYDLLDPKHEASKLEDLPKVSLLEDSDSNVHLKNLSLHQASNEEEALNLLFIGDTNRMIAETPMNQASTRSHCIFTIHLMSREPGSATIRRAKLHLVDLAGSERVGKTNVGGTLLTEAKYINLSLHYLEQVIVALSEKSRSHIPYRNSMMTSVLRDSLGGNCMTCMIATCSVDKKNLDESISTCRFAQRVAMIKNDVSLNEEVDPKLMIERLRREIQKLKDELALSTGEQRTGELSPDETDRLRSLVRSFIEDADPEAELSVGADMRKIDCCFHLLKGHVLEARSQRSTPQSRTSVIDGSVDSSYLGDQTEVSKLKDLVKQRDNEINILVGMLKKEKKRASDAEDALRQGGRGPPRGAINPTASDDSESELANQRPFSGTRGRERRAVQTSESREHPRVPSESPSEERPSSAYKRRLDEMSAGRKEAFDTFRRDYPHNSTIEGNKATLKQRYAEAKSLGEQVNSSRQKINSLKTQIEQHRVRRSMQGFVNGVDEPSDVDPQEQRLRQAIETEKSRYKESFTRLRSLKTEIEHLQHLLEKSKVQMQKDFELWWAEQASAAAKIMLHNTSDIPFGTACSPQTPLSSSSTYETLPPQPPADVRAAWRTPPISPLRPGRENSRPPSSGRQRGDWGGASAVDEHEHKASRSGKVASRLRAEAQLAASGLSGSSQSSRDLDHVTRESSNDRTSSWSRAADDTSNERTNGAWSGGAAGGVQLTGDSRADADILAFIRARQNVLQRKGRR